MEAIVYKVIGLTSDVCIYIKTYRRVATQYWLVSSELCESVRTSYLIEDTDGKLLMSQQGIPKLFNTAEQALEAVKLTKTYKKYYKQ